MLRLWALVLAANIVGSIDAFYLVETGEAGWLDYLWRFFLPTLIAT